MRVCIPVFPRRNVNRTSERRDKEDAKKDVKGEREKREPVTIESRNTITFHTFLICVTYFPFIIFSYERDHPSYATMNPGCVPNRREGRKLDDQEAKPEGGVSAEGSDCFNFIRTNRDRLTKERGKRNRLSIVSFDLNFHAFTDSFRAYTHHILK